MRFAEARGKWATPAPISKTLLKQKFLKLPADKGLLRRAIPHRIK
jgi:hypothetical protein